MKFGCKIEDLVSGVEIVQNCVSTTGAIPIISNILLEAKSGELELTGTNLEMGIRTSVKAEVKEEGEIALLARKLHEIVRELPLGEIVKLETRDGFVGLECGNSHFRVICSAADDFPRLQVFEGKTNFRVRGIELAKLINKNIFSVAQIESRYSMNGLLLEFEGDELRVVGTNGRRLTFGATQLSEGSAEERIRCIVPTQAAKEVARLFGEDEDVSMETGETQISFGCGKTIIISRLVSGQFPDYERVIPAKHTMEAKLDREQLLATCRRVRTMAEKERNVVRFTFEEGAGVAAVSSPDIGEAIEEVEMEYQGDHLEVAYNVDYLVDLLRAMESERVRIELTGSEKAAIIRPEGDEKYLCVLMPMKF